ncbi:MAG TPA: PA14 domain-containing protein [Pirellulales bacterium]|jgi:hypothetical protein|nr:PA14 domain-containing protein [Pirellulales bacterium]
MPEHFDAYHTWLGIPPAEQPPHHYRLLGVSLFEKNADVIEHAADRQMAHLRSMNAGKRGALTQNLLDEVSKARVCLLDAKKKAAYDEQLRAKIAASAAPVAAIVPAAASAAAYPAQSTSTPGLGTDLPFDLSGGGDSPFSAATATVSHVRPIVKRHKSAAGGPPVLGIVIGVGAAFVVAAVLYPVVSNALADKSEPAVNNNHPVQIAEAHPKGEPAVNQTTNHAAAPGEHGATAKEVTAQDPKAAHDPGAKETAVNTQTPVTTPVKPKPPAIKKPSGSAHAASVEDEIFGPTPSDPNSGNASKLPTATEPGDGLIQDKPLPTAKTQLPVPTNEQLQKSEKLAHELFAKEFSEAKKAPEKIVLANALVKQVGETKGDPVSEYTLLMLGRDAAIGGGDTALAMQIIDSLASKFAINKGAMRAESLAKLVETATTPAAQQAIVDVGLAAADEAAEADDYDLALKLARTALEGARMTKDGKLVKQVTDRGRELTVAQRIYTAYLAAKETLQSDAANPEANLVVGRWHWFTKNESDKALPFLAKSSDAELKGAAGKELAPPKMADQQLEVADAWWDIAQANKVDAEKTQLAQHAEQWYNKSLAELTGLQKAKAEKRIADITAYLEKLAAKNSDKPAATVAKARILPGLMGEYFTGRNFDNQVGTHVDASPTLQFSETAGSQFPLEDFSIRWTGWIVPPKPGTYKFYVSSNDGCRVSVDGKVVVDCWKEVEERGNPFARFAGKGGRGREFFNRPPEPNKGEGSVELTKEPHAFKVEYYQARGTKSLAIEWELNGSGPQAIAAQYLFHDPPKKK